MRLNQKGMTLIEIMIVLAILGGLMTVLVPNLLDAYTRARVRQSTIQLNNIKMGLRNYLLDCGKFPSTDVGLDALVRDPGESVCRQWGPRGYLEARQLVDQFGHAFGYEYENGKASLTFYGKDGRPGGSGYAKDVTEEEED